MPRNSYRPTLFAPMMLWADLALKTTEMLFASGQVIGTRLAQVARAGANPTPRDIQEFALMGSEKVKAATQSGLAVASRVQAAHYQWMTRGWQPWLASLGAMTALSANTARLLGAALAPVHGAATANARRLARSRKGY